MPEKKPKKLKAAHAVYVVVECISCKKRRNVGPGEIPSGDVPMCDDCSMPMVAKEARGTLR